MSAPSTNFVFTLNNPTDEELVVARRDPPKSPIRWIGFEPEIGDSGTLHLQGVVVLGKRKTIAGLKKVPPFKRAHLEVMRGRLEQSEVYCSKEGSFESYGDRPKSSVQKGADEKARHTHINSLAKSGDLDVIEELYPDVWRRDYKTLKLIASDYMMKPAVIDGDLENEWIYGTTGTGKTKSAFERFPHAYLKKADTHWWDGYQGEETVIIDDFDKYFVKQGYHLKIWADRYPFMAETKGGSKMIRPKRIIVTSNYRIDDIWDDPQTLEPMKRRFKQICQKALKKYDDTLPAQKKKEVDLPSSPAYQLPPWEVPTIEPAWLYNNPQLENLINTL